MGTAALWEQLKTNFILVASNPVLGTRRMEKSVSKLNNAGFATNRCFCLAAVKTVEQSSTLLSGHAMTTKQGIHFVIYKKCLLQAFKVFFLLKIVFFLKERIEANNKVI